MSTLDEVRREFSEVVEEDGNRIVAAGTHPLSAWQDQPITPGEHYQRVLDTHQQMAHEQLVFGLHFRVGFGFHVHVGLSDREAAVQVVNRIRLWLAPMLALSANSSFWSGADTDYASYRSQVDQTQALQVLEEDAGSASEIG